MDGAAQCFVCGASIVYTAQYLELGTRVTVSTCACSGDTSVHTTLNILPEPAQVSVAALVAAGHRPPAMLTRN
jgi:hypothetical protein